MQTQYGKALRTYRRAQRVTQQQLSEALGYSHASHIHRRELRGMTRVEYAEAIAAIERIVAARMQVTPKEVL